jgi:hypothetical protein
MLKAQKLYAFVTILLVLSLHAASLQVSGHEGSLDRRSSKESV